MHPLTNKATSRHGEPRLEGVRETIIYVSRVCICILSETERWKETTTREVSFRVFLKSVAWRGKSRDHLGRRLRADGDKDNGND